MYIIPNMDVMCIIPNMVYTIGHIGDNTLAPVSDTSTICPFSRKIFK